MSIPTTVSPERMDAPAPYQILEERAASIEARADELHFTIIDAQRNSNPADQSQNAQYQIYVESTLAAQPDRTIAEVTDEAIQENPDVHPVIHRNFGTWLEQINRLKLIDNALEEYKPQKREDLLKEVADIESRVDYEVVVDKMLLYATKGIWINEDAPISFAEHATRIQHIGKLLGSETELSYGEILLLERHFKELTDPTKHDLSFIRDEPVVDTEGEESWITDEIAAGLQIRHWTIRELRSKYRTYEDEQADAYDKVLNLLIYTTSREGHIDSVDAAINEWPDLGTNPRFVSTIKRRFEKIIEELPVHDFELSVDSLRYRQALPTYSMAELAINASKFEFKGTPTELPFEHDESALRSRIMIQVPTIAVANVKSVEIRNLTDQEKEDYQEGGIILGLHKFGDQPGDAEIIMSLDATQARYQHFLGTHKGTENSDAQAAAQASAEYVSTLLHEFGHSLHNVLPMAAVAFWDKARESEDVYVTDYVKQRFEEDHPAKYKEDFCESFRLLLTEPHILLQKSPARFKAMVRIMKDLNPLYDQHVAPFIADKLEANRE